LQPVLFILVHTMEELKLTGNHLKGSRPLLTFSANFDKDAHWKLLKEMIIQVFWFLFPTLEATFICVLSYNAWLYHQILHSLKDNREIPFQNIFQWQSLPGNMVNKYDWYSSIYNFCNNTSAPLASYGLVHNSMVREMTILDFFVSGAV